MLQNAPDNHCQQTVPSTSLELDHGLITYKDAADSEDNVINQLAYFRKTKMLFNHLWEQTRSIEALTAHHLGRSQNEACIVQDQRTWIRGSFNICIPVEVKCRNETRKVVMRCPMPHKLAEARYPRNIPATRPPIAYTQDMQMLSTSWKGSQEDPTWRKNLFRDMARLILARIP